jgi:hypothetical protein
MNICEVAEMILSRHSSGKIRVNKEDHSGYPMTRPVFEPNITKTLALHILVPENSLGLGEVSVETEINKNTS